MVHGVDDGALHLISPYIRVRLASTPAGFAVHASSAIDDASHTAAHTLDTTPCFEVRGGGARK